MTRDTPHEDAFRPEHNIAFFASAPHDCSYLPDQTAVTVFADPEATMDMARYSALAEFGFRRSGKHVYIPHCPTCRACVPARIPVDGFRPNRNQRRTLKHFQALHKELTIRCRPPVFRREHFQLYRRYLRARHPGGGMDDPSPNHYMDFLISPWAHTEFVEFRLHNRILAVAIMDVLTHGLSSVYTFFDPEFSGISPGKFVLLWQIQEARRRKLPWLLLGFWIRNCRKMEYKQEYRPLELFIDNRWQRFTRDQHLP